MCVGRSLRDTRRRVHEENWAIYAVVILILGVCLIVGVIAFPFFAARPLSKSELLHFEQPSSVQGEISAKPGGDTGRAQTALHKSNPTVSWNVSSATTADVDCDGKPDTVMLGSEKDKVVVGVVWGASAKQSQIFVFPVRGDTQDGFCSNPKTIEVSPLDCQSNDGPLPGCKAATGCKAFSILDDGCDSFNFYWDSSRGTLAWWRR